MSQLAERFLNFKKGEFPLAFLSALFYFCVLCGYYFLRPTRDAMGVSRGMDDLHWLFAGTAFASLVFVLLFGGVVSRLDRRRFIPLAYLFVIVCLMIFAGLLVADGIEGGGLIGTDAGTTTSLVVGYTFYVWLSVINLFVNSIFWAFMVDVFDVDQGKRMFAFIGIGGTLGAAAGSFATDKISDLTHSVFLPPGLMLTGAAFFGGAILIMLALDRMAMASAHSRLGGAAAPTVGSMAGGDTKTRPDVVGGSFLDGARSLIGSPYLLGISGFFVLMAISNTLIYFTQANVVLDSTDNFSQRVGGFAQFDFLAQIATLFTQIFVTTQVIKRLGVGWTLSILPLVTVAGFAVLAVWPVYGVMAIFQALQRATRYAVTRPARETLFAVVPTAEKYKAKPVIDVFVYRSGDFLGTGIDAAFRVIGLTLTGIALAAVPFAALWSLLCLGLGRAQQDRVRQNEPQDTGTR
jgi:ATP:ADP antiporter, AAA family